MRKVQIVSMLGILLLMPLTVWAHELSPLHYPLGPWPVLTIAEMRFMIFALPIVLVVEAFVLHIWARELGAKANLWRVAILYVVARADETIAYLSLGVIGSHFGWVAPGWTSSVAETFGSLLFCLFAGFLPKILVALPLYKATPLTRRQIVSAVGVATLSGYFAVLALGFIARGAL